MEARFVDEDPIEPTAIEHKCEEIFDGDRLEQRYNFLIYHFELGDAYFWARAYLDNIKSVSLHGPFESRATMKPSAGSHDEAVLAYLKRRFCDILTLQKDGYAPLQRS